MTDTLPYDADLAGEPDGSGPKRLEALTCQVTMDDGTSYTVAIRNPDYLRYDEDRTRKGWPDGRQVPILYQTYCTWAALTRTGQLPDRMPWEVFRRQALEIDGRAQPVDPTRPDPGAG